MKHYLSRLRHWWSGRIEINRSQSIPAQFPILLVVEGTNDILFLRTISTILSHSDPTLPDLQKWEMERRCLFLPAGGELPNWTMHVAALRIPQFYLFDRETGAASDARRAHVSLLNLNPHLRAHLTGKRALENYLSAEAVRDGLGLDIEIDDDSTVADDAAQAILRRLSPDRSWEALPPRSRKRRRDRAKRLLNTIAVRHMTVEPLMARDPCGELVGWLRAINELPRLAIDR